MFWKFEDGKLFNLNALDQIYLSGRSVKGLRRDPLRFGELPEETLFRSPDKKLAKKVLKGIAEELDAAGVVISADKLKVDQSEEDNE